MTKTARRWLSTVSPAPEGFALVALTKRHLLHEPVTLLVSELAEVELLLPDYRQRFVGVIVTPGSPVSLTALSPQAWHAILPLPLDDTARALISGWLQSIEHADQAQQSGLTGRARNERLARELASTQADYHTVTERLRGQVDELLAAKWALSDSNLALESRVARRTTALAEALGSLTQAQSELVQKEKLAVLGSMVAGVAHELNTPIGNALTVATTLRHEARQLRNAVENGTLKRSALERFTTESDEMTEVLERNLHIAAEFIGHFKQLAVDQTSENRRQFLLSDVVSDTLSALSPRLRKSEHQIKLTLDDSVRLDSYPGAVSQVLTNLIINALVHAFDSRKQGLMQLQSYLSEDKKSVEIVFSDNGVGITEAHQRRVFDPFFTTRLGEGGSGLGMNLVYNLVTAMLGGRINLRSASGAGTQIRLNLPLIAPQVMASS